MKQNFLSLLTILCTLSVCAQPELKKYPEPEFSKEVYYLKKDSEDIFIIKEKDE